MACFVIHGSTIIEHVRALVAEGQFRQAYQVLKDSFELDDATYLSILKGEKTITGDSSSGMDLIDCDETAAVAKALDDIAFNYFTLKGKTHRVVAVLRTIAVSPLPALDEEDVEFNLSALQKAEAFVKCHGLNFNDTDMSSSEKEEILVGSLAKLMANSLLSHLELGYAYTEDKLPVIYLAEQASLDLPYWYVLPSIPSTQALALATDISCEADSVIDMIKLIQGKESVPDALLPAIVKSIRIDAAEQVKFAEQLSELKQKIVEYADTDTLFGWEHISYKEDGAQKVLRVPRHAYLAYLLKSHGFLFNVLKSSTADKMHPDLERVRDNVYTAFSTSGLKMANDCPAHTDAWIGAGLDLEDAYERKHPASNAFYNYGSEYFYSSQENQSFTILSKGKALKLSGTIATLESIVNVPSSELKHTILCLPFANAEALVWAVKCKGVVVEQGGKLAHMVLVSREQAIPVVRIDNAMSLFKANDTLHLNFEDQTWICI